MKVYELMELLRQKDPNAQVLAAWLNTGGGLVCAGLGGLGTEAEAETALLQDRYRAQLIVLDEE